MPSVREIELKDGSIETTLARSKRHLLPETVLGDPLARWILEFDQPPGERRPERDPRETGDPVFAMMVKELSEGVVQPTLNFYHAALMHLGPQWAVAEEGLERTKALLQDDNLERSIRDVEARLALLSGEPGGGRDRVALFAHQVAGAWGDRLKLVTRAWQTWREEVGELKRVMRQAEHGLSDPYERRSTAIFKLLDHCVKPSRLSHHGFPDRREMALGQTISIVALAGIFFLSDANRRSGEHRFYEFEALLRNLGRADEERARVPIIVEEMRALAAEYADVEPFEAYFSEFKPADEALHRLAVHNRHSGGEPSRWLREFQSALRTLSDWPLPNGLFGEDSELHQLAEWGAITADAEIKEYALGTPRAFHAHSAQTAFEREWVYAVARHLFKKGAKLDSPTTLRFYDLVRDVAIILAKRGNVISVPSEERLKSLVAKIVQDGYFYGDW